VSARSSGPWGYLARLSAGSFVLWCYFIWWSVVLVRDFDPNPLLWLTSLGLSVIIGAALYINTTSSGRVRVTLEPWPTFRLFLTPFCVSSFAALVKGQGFILIFSPHWEEMAVAAGACAAFGGLALFARRFAPPVELTEGTETCR
jgi:hypothetical protein